MAKAFWIRGFRHLYAGFGLVALLLGSACVDNYKRDLTHAQKAENDGDLYTAARYYRQACNGKRKRQNLCEHAQQLEQRAIESDTQRARQACRKNDTNACLKLITRAADHAPQDMRVLEVLQLASAQLVDACLANFDIRTAQGALAQVRCLQHANQRLAFAPHQARVTKARIFASAALAKLADAATDKRPGARYALFGLAQCAAPNAELTRQNLASRKALLHEVAVPLNVELRLNNKNENGVEKLLCQHLAQSFDGAITCSSKKTGLRIAVDIKQQTPQHTTVVEQRLARYHAGTDIVENPEYRAAQERNASAQRAFERIEQETLDRKASCEAAISALNRANNCDNCYQRTSAERECAAYEAIRGNYNARVYDQAAAASAEQNTSKTVSYNKYADFAYEATLHSWKANYSVVIQTSFHPTAQREHGTISYQDVEHVGFAPAGLRADPLEMPSDSYFANQAVEQVLSTLRNQIGAELDRRAAAQRPLCEAKDLGEIDQLDCRSRVAILRRRAWKQGNSLFPAHLGLEDASQIDSAIECQSARPICSEAWVGMALRTVEPREAARANLDRPRGAYIESIEPESPADKAGLLAGDIIVSVQQLRLESPADFGALIHSMPCASSFELRTRRAEQSGKHTMQLATRVRQ